MSLAPQETRTYFVTTVSARRRRLFQVSSNALLLLDLLQEQRARQHLELHAFVLMPDHVHLALTPSPTLSLERVLQYIKGGFSFRLPSQQEVWQRGYDSRRLCDAHDFAAHVQYIHHNPVRAHLAPAPELYPYSSAAPDYLTRIDPPPLHFR
jgi:putative transposase